MTPEWEVTRRQAGQLGRGRSMSRRMEVGKRWVEKAGSSPGWLKCKV